MNCLLYTSREGAHSTNRILYLEDITGKEITSKLYAEAKTRKNITIEEYVTLTDLIVKNGKCVVVKYAKVMKNMISMQTLLYLQLVVLVVNIRILLTTVI